MTIQHQITTAVLDVLQRSSSTEGQNVVLLESESYELGQVVMTTVDQATTAQRACLTDLLTYTIPEILLNVERAYLRGEVLPADWFVRQLTDLENEILAVL